MLKVGSMISEKTCRLNVYSLVVNLSRGWGHCNQFSSNNASILLYFSKQVPAFFAMDLHCGVENGSILIYFLVANIYFVYNGVPGNGLRSPAQCRNGPHGLSWLWTLGPLTLHGKYLVKCGPRGVRPGHTCCGAHLDGRSGQLEDWAPVVWIGPCLQLWLVDCVEAVALSMVWGHEFASLVWTWVSLTWTGKPPALYNK